MLQLLKTLVCFSLLIISTGSIAAVTATLDRPRGAVASPFLLTLEVEQSDAASPDISALEADFAVLGSRKTALSNFKNGRSVFTQRWLITLSPRHAGHLTIPAITVGNESSQPLAFEALSTGANPTNERLTLETSLELPLVYSRSAVTLNVRLFYLDRLQHAEITEPLIDDVQVYPLGGQRYFKEQRRGQLYGVIEQRYALIPERAGRYRIPALMFSGKNATGEQINTASRALEFEALAWPISATGAQLAASELRINATWDRQPDELRAGDTITRTLTIEGHNLPASWLPRPAIDAPQGVRAYPQPETVEQQVINGVLVSRLTLPYRLLFTEERPVQLPAIDIPWWDAVREQRDVATLAAENLIIRPFLAPAGGPAAAAPAKTAPSTVAKGAQPSDSPSWIGWLWALAALICGAGWSLSRARLRQLEEELKHTRQTLSQLSGQRAADNRYLEQEKQAFSRLEHSCRYGDPQQICQGLVAWARSFWPDQRINSLGDIEQAAAAPTLTYLLRNLDHRLRTGDEDEPWHGDLALEQIGRLRHKRSVADAPNTPPHPQRIADHVEA